MKKIWIALLALSLLLALSSCAAEKHDLLYEVEEGNMTYCVRGTGERARQIVVKKGEDILWRSDIKVDAKLGALDGDYGLACPDLNFDGNPDLMIADGKSGDAVSYLCWLWNADKGTYQKSDALSGLCNIKADKALSAIFAFTHAYTYEGPYEDAPASSETSDSVIKYVWIEGVLIPDMRVSITYYSATELYCYSVEYYNPDTEQFESGDDDWLTPEEYAEADLSFLYYFK